MTKEEYDNKTDRLPPEIVNAVIGAYHGSFNSALHYKNMLNKTLDNSPKEDYKRLFNYYNGLYEFYGKWLEENYIGSWSKTKL